MLLRETVIVLRSEVGAAGVPQRLAVGIVHNELQAVVELLLERGLQPAVVVRRTSRLQIADGGIHIREWSARRGRRGRIGGWLRLVAVEVNVGAIALGAYI